MSSWLPAFESIAVVAAARLVVPELSGGRGRWQYLLQMSQSDVGGVEMR